MACGQKKSAPHGALFELIRHRCLRHFVLGGGDSGRLRRFGRSDHYRQILGNRRNRRSLFGTGGTGERFRCSGRGRRRFGERGSRGGRSRTDVRSRSENRKRCRPGSENRSGFDDGAGDRHGQRFPALLYVRAATGENPNALADDLGLASGDVLGEFGAGVHRLGAARLDGRRNE